MSNRSSYAMAVERGVPPLLASVGAGHLVATDTVPTEAETPVRVRQDLTLTPRQRQLVELAADGNTEREIAELTGLHERTVGQHLYMARKRIGARNTAHAVAIAIRHGLVL